MVKLPRIRKPRLIRWTRFPLLSSVRGRIIAGLGVLVITLVVVVAGHAWQHRQHLSDMAEMEEHADASILLESARLEAASAALILQRYIITGDDTQIAEFGSSVAAAVDSLGQARAHLKVTGGGNEKTAKLDRTLAAIAPLAADAEEIIRLRQGGDVEGAATILEATVPAYEQFALELQEIAEAERQEVAALRSQADRTGDLALWLLVLSGAIGVILALTVSLATARSILKPLSSLESTARAVTAGNMDARSDTRGPRELKHLSKTLNSMIATVQQRTDELRLANEELEERYRQLTEARAQATTDALTGLGNHRAFHLRIGEEIGQAAEVGAPVGLIILDIDGFKGVNDSQGHLVGDEVLRSVANSLASEVGRKDAYRYGGDEFAVIVPEGDRQKTARTAEALRRAVARGANGSDGKVTISLGIASFPETAESAEELVYRADAAMYWAKSAGKNRVGDWNELAKTSASEGPTPATEPPDGTGSPIVPTGHRR